MRNYDIAGRMRGISSEKEKEIREGADDFEGSRTDAKSVITTKNVKLHQKIKTRRSLHLVSSKYLLT
ncbi:hypothetical protein CEK27_000082 [Fusarium fujikuroi]|nr:hypothetical protein CEK27_000082 [Fusarium fujikuroi]